MAEKTLPAESGGSTSLPQDSPEAADPFRQVANRFIDDFFTSFDLLPLSVFEDTGGSMPKVSVTHDRKVITVTVELPGMEADDVDIALGSDTLVLSGKRNTGKGKGPGNDQSIHFRKIIPIPLCIDAQGAKAVLERGVLRVTLPRRNDGATRQRIPIKT